VRLLVEGIAMRRRLVVRMRFGLCGRGWRERRLLELWRAVVGELIPRHVTRGTRLSTRGGRTRLGCLRLGRFLLRRLPPLGLAFVACDLCPSVLGTAPWQLEVLCDLGVAGQSVLTTLPIHGGNSTERWVWRSPGRYRVRVCSGGGPPRRRWSQETGAGVASPAGDAPSPSS